MTAPTPRSLGRDHRRLLAGYGPLLALVVVFLLIVMMAPTIAPQERVIQRGVVRNAADSNDPNAPPLDGDTGAIREVQGGDGAGRGLPASGGGDIAAPTACADGRTQQIPGDTYSPPCFDWPAGADNGGATARGVTADEILISFRIPVEDVRDFMGVVSQLTEGKTNNIPIPTEADIRRTVDNLVEYFNRNFQFYGRKVRYAEVRGQGSAVKEIVGGGQEAANADAIKVAQEVGAFADVSAFTQPYNDALARQGVIAIGAPYMSREWFNDPAHRPYSWSILPDCTSLAETAAEYVTKRVLPYPAAFAGGDMKGKPRKVGIVAPDNLEYQQCVDSAEKVVNDAGYSINRYSYTLDLATASDQANSVAAKLKDDGITTVVLASDPLVPLLLSSRLAAQGVEPEWVLTGAGFTDIDIVGRFMGSAWERAFGISYFAEQQRFGQSYAYFACKSVDPEHEPIFGVELLYYFFYTVAIGIQMAGPNLTPETFQAGMHAYPGGYGPAGTWGFPQGEYTPYRDAREIFWSPTAPSNLDGAAGAYVSNGKRYRYGEWPVGEATRPQ